MILNRRLVRYEALSYACDVIHNEVFEAAVILLLWVITTPCKRDAPPLYATQRPREWMDSGLVK